MAFLICALRQGREMGWRCQLKEIESLPKEGAEETMKIRIR